MMKNITFRDPLFKIKGVSKSYGRVLVLRGIELNIGFGEVLTILGANGSGKTTLINIAATLIKPDSGTVFMAGRDLLKVGQVARKSIGVVTHSSLLYDELTGYENLKFTGRMFNLDFLDDRIDNVVRQLGVTDRIYDKIGILSHGLRKRISIARALLHDPILLLMDEPSSGLDQHAVEMLTDVVNNWVVKRRSVLITTHILDHSLMDNGRLAILSRGKIAYEQLVDSSTDFASLRDRYIDFVGDVK